MPAHRLNIPVPAALIDDLEIAVEWATANLPEPHNPGHQEALKPIRAALHGLRGNIHHMKAHRAEYPLSVPVELMNAAYLEVLRKLLNNVSKGNLAERLAIDRVATWLNGA